MILTEVHTGQQVRVQLLQDIIGTDDEALERLAATAKPGQRFEVPKKVIAMAGTVYEGVVTDVDDVGFFDLNLPNGDAIGFCIGDPTILVTETT